MPAIKISHVVSFSSEDAVHRAENLLAPSKKWRSGSAGEKQVSAVLQLERASLISSIDIGNDGSAFVEVLVGRRESGGGGGERDYTTLLAASSFMTPIESRNEEMSSRVRIFSADKLSAEAREEKWDRVKVVCTQPFNSRVKYGLSFLKLNEKDLEGTQEQKKATTSLGAFKLREEKKETGLGSWFAKKKNSEDSGMTTKAAAVVASPAAELRSERTLAAMALKESGTSPKKRDKMMAQFRPDNNGNKRKAPPAAAAGQGSTKNKLPRRDGVPGDSPPPPKKRDKKGSPSPSPSTPARRRPFLEAATPSSSSSSSAKKKGQSPSVAARSRGDGGHVRGQFLPSRPTSSDQERQMEMQIRRAIELSLESENKEGGEEVERDSPRSQNGSPESSPPQLVSDADDDRELELAIQISQKEFESQRKRQLKEDEMLERAIALSMNQK